MKFFLRKVIVRSWFAVSLIQRILLMINRKKYMQLIKSRNVDLFSWKNLASRLPYPALDVVFDNNMYGIGHVFKNFMGTKKQIKGYFEHGLFFGDHIQFDQNYWDVNSIVTFSGQRKNILGERTNKKIITVGPYICYAKGFLSNADREKIKKKLGSTILVFPAHSTSTLNANYSVENLIDKLNKIKKDNCYDNILMCLYWKDIENKNLLELFLKNKFIILTAGHKWDMNFLDRLKTIIELADVTVSNEVGTHLGYCIALNKPHTIINNDVLLSPTQDEYQNIIEMEYEIKRRTQIKEVEKEFINNSGDIFLDISNNQKIVVNKYWGIDQIKTKKELLSLLYKCNEKI